MHKFQNLRHLQQGYCTESICPKIEGNTIELKSWLVINFLIISKIKNPERIKGEVKRISVNISNGSTNIDLITFESS